MVRTSLYLFFLVAAVLPLHGGKRLRKTIIEKDIQSILPEYTPIKKRQNYRMPEMHFTGSIALSKQQWDRVKKLVKTKKEKTTEIDRYIQTCMILHHAVYDCRWKSIEPDPLRRQLRSLFDRWKAKKIWCKICKALELPQL